MKPKDIDRFFEDLSRRIDQPVQILLTGGAAAILQGVERATFDIDFEAALKRGRGTSRSTEDSWSLVQKAISDSARLTGIAPQYSENIDQWSSIAMPDKKSRLYRRFGKVEVRILDPTLWAIGKLARYLSSDVQDLRVVLKARKVRPTTAVKLWGTALGISPMSSAQGTFRKQVESFLDHYTREIWGASADAVKLKRLFVETAQKANREKTRLNRH